MSNQEPTQEQSPSLKGRAAALSKVYDGQQILDLSRRLQDYARQYELLREEMDRNGIDQFELPNFPSLQLGFAKLRSHINAAWDTLNVIIDEQRVEGKIDLVEKQNQVQGNQQQSQRSSQVVGEQQQATQPTAADRTKKLADLTRTVPAGTMRVAEPEADFVVESKTNKKKREAQAKKPVEDKKDHKTGTG